MNNCVKVFLANGEAFISNAAEGNKKIPSNILTRTTRKYHIAKYGVGSMNTVN